MKVVVKNDVVRNNIMLFQELLEKEGLADLTLEALTLKTYRAFVDKKTGKVHFPRDQKSKPSDEIEWKLIIIELNINPSGDLGIFEVFQEERECFCCEDLHPHAYKILSETFHVLNHVSRQFISRFNDLDQFVSSFSNLEIEEGIHRILGKDLVHEAWHQLDRMGAEKVLRKQNVGTFLFRKDEYAKILEEQLRKTFRCPVTCFTITYIEWEHKVCDKTIVVKDLRWIFYNDDPCLAGPSYSDIYALLESESGFFINPLMQERLSDVEQEREPGAARRIG